MKFLGFLWDFLYEGSASLGEEPESAKRWMTPKGFRRQLANYASGQLSSSYRKPDPAWAAKFKANMAIE